MKKASGKSNLSIVRDYVDGNRPFIQVGYNENSTLQDRKEGEEWEDSLGNKWKKENGVKKRIPKASRIKIDEKCSICNADIKFGNYLDQRVYNRCGKCFDCSVTFDTKLKLLGKFNEYARFSILNDRISKLKDFENKINESITYLENYDPKLQYFNEDGSQEFWTDNTDQRIKVLEDLKKDKIEVEKQLSECISELAKVEYDSSIEEKAKEMVLDSIKNRESRKFDV